MPGRATGEGGNFDLAALRFTSRWSRTASRPVVDPALVGLGDPVRLTWSLVPDGTVIPGGSEGGGEASSGSDLREFLDGLYGDEEEWLPLLRRVFERWSVVTGVEFVYDPADDGASFPESVGVLGVRGDVRLGGHPIDGDSGLLAYSFFPDRGDTVLDTGDGGFSDLSGDSIVLRNVLAHEIGHQLGLGHVCPEDGSKLMEAGLVTTFDGPQGDDILTAQRLYGDRFEPNDRGLDGGAAGGLGKLGEGEHEVAFLSLDALDDRDIYRLSVVPNDADVSVTLRPTGSTYFEAAELPGGGCEEASLFDSLRVLDLALRVIDRDGSNVIAVADGAGLGEAESLAGLQFRGGGDYFLEVTGSGTDSTQLYQIEIGVRNAQLDRVISVADGAVAEGEGAMEFVVSLSEASSTEVRVDYHTDDGTAVSPDDYGALEGSVLFPVGVTERRIFVPVVDDGLDEADEIFRVVFGDASGATLLDQVAEGRIADDDALPVVSIGMASPFESAATVTVEATLSAPSGREVTVDFATVDGLAVGGVDFVPVENGVVFAPGETRRPIVIELMEDETDESNEWFLVRIARLENATAGEDGRVTIIDNDPLPVITVGDASGSENGGMLSFPFVLSRPSGRSVAFGVLLESLSADVEEDLVPGLLWLEVPVGETEGRIDVVVNDDVDEEADERFLMVPGLAVAADVDGIEATGTIVDDDAPRAFAERAGGVDLSGWPDSIELSWVAVSGRHYAVETSDDLVEWRRLAGAAAEAVSDVGRLVVPVSGADRFVRVVDVAKD